MQRPMSMNGYSWVEGNTPNLTDPSGKSPALAATLNDGVCQAQNQECSRTHIVQSGETLNSIANRYEIESLELDFIHFRRHSIKRPRDHAKHQQK